MAEQRPRRRAYHRNGPRRSGRLAVLLVLVALLGGGAFVILKTGVEGDRDSAPEPRPDTSAASSPVPPPAPAGPVDIRGGASGGDREQAGDAGPRAEPADDGPPLEAADALVRVDAGAVVHRISETLVGLNLGLFHDTDDVWRRENLPSVYKDLGVRILRYPGGGEMSLWHWRHPGGTRKFRYDLWAPKGHTMHNPPDDLAKSDDAAMSVDEFVAHCRHIGAEPLVGINFESGVRFNRLDDSLQEAVDLVAHCRERGHKVRFWELDNEFYMMPVDEVIGIVNTFVPAMRRADPSIKIILNNSGVLNNPSNVEKWKRILDKCGKHIDYVDMHWYWGWTKPGKESNATWENWLANKGRMVNRFGWFGTNTYVKDCAILRGLFEERGLDIGIMVLECNVGPRRKRPPEEWLSQYQIVLIQSEMFMEFVRENIAAASVWPNMSGDTRSCIQSPRYWGPKEEQRGIELRPSYHVPRLFAKLCGHDLVRSAVKAETYLPHVAVRHRDGSQLDVLVINKEERPLSVKVAVEGSGFSRAGLLVFHSDDVTKLSNQNLKQTEGHVQVRGSEARFEMPGWSLARLTLQ